MDKVYVLVWHDEGGAIEISLYDTFAYLKKVFERCRKADVADGHEISGYICDERNEDLYYRVEGEWEYSGFGREVNR